MDVSKGPVAIDHAFDRALFGGGTMVLVCWGVEGKLVCEACRTSDPGYDGIIAYYDNEANLTRENYARYDGCEKCQRTFVDWRDPNAKGVTVEERIRILEDQVEQMKVRWPGAFHQGRGFKGPGSF